MTGGSFPRKVCDGRCVCVPFWKAGCGHGGGDLVMWTGDGPQNDDASARPFFLSFCLSFVRSFVRSFVLSFRYFVRSFFLPSFLPSFIPSFLPTYLPSFLPSFLPMPSLTL